MHADQKQLIKQYDTSVNKFLANKIILAWILKECTDEFKDIPVDIIAKKCIIGNPEISVTAVDQDETDREDNKATDIEGLNTEEASVNEGKIYYDIRFRAKTTDGSQAIYMIVNIEAQKDDNPGYPLIKRSVYYACRLISAQKGKVFTGSHYEKIQKVYSIWIEMNPAKINMNTITKYRIMEENVIGNRKAKSEHYNLINIVMIGLGEKNSIKEKSILRLLNIALNKESTKPEVDSVLKNEFGISYHGTLGKELNTMCNLGEGIAEAVRKEVTEEVTASVTASVTDSVLTDTWMKDAVNIMKKFNISADEAVDILDIPTEKRDIILSLIEEQMVPVA